MDNLPRPRGWRPTGGWHRARARCGGRGGVVSGAYRALAAKALLPLPRVPAPPPIPQPEPRELGQGEWTAVVGAEEGSRYWYLD